MPHINSQRDRFAALRSTNLLMTRRMRDMNDMGQAFAASRDGNIAILFVFMSVILFLFVGGALDYTRWNSVRADMIESMDASALAMAQLAAADDTLTDAQLKTYGQQFFEENFQQKTELSPGWQIEFDLSNSQFIGACVDGAIDTHLLGVAGINQLDVDKCVEITKKGSGRIELALVLDVTGSMDSSVGGVKKIDSLKDAVTALLDTLFDGDATSDNLKVGVVPFNQHVNAGGASSWDASWGDANAESFYHGKRFFHVDETGAVDASTKVNHYRLYDTIPNHSWEGCTEARPYPLDELDTEPGQATTSAIITAAMASLTPSEEPDDTMRAAFDNMPSLPHGLTASDIASAANSRFVPVFLGDTTDCNSDLECENNQLNGNNPRKKDTSGTVSGMFWDGEWYKDPDSDNNLTWVEESAYSFNGDQYFLVGDREITYRNHNSVGFDHYLPVLRYFRDVVSGSVSDPDFEDWMDFNRISSAEQEYIARMGYVGWWNPTTSEYDYKYEWAQGSGNPNPSDCPEAILPLTDTRADIDGGDGSGGIMATLTANGYTNIPIGAVWGWRVVSPEAPFNEAIGDGETGPGGSTFSQWQKAVVIMTDGNNDFAGRNTHWGSLPSAFGYEFEERMGDNVSRADGHTSSNGFHDHSSSERRMEEEADDKVLRICRRMKEEDILVYTIVFDVGSGSAIEDVFRSCATEPNAPYFFNAPNGDDLEDAFQDIAADLVSLHISK